MKKIKLIALLMAALTVTAAFTGCGKNDTPETSTPTDELILQSGAPADNTENSTVTPENTETMTETPEAEATATAEESTGTAPSEPTGTAAPTVTATPAPTATPKPTATPTPAPTAKPAHTHSFSAATCTKPKTCSACGATEGKDLGHTPSEANYQDAVPCSVCGEMVGPMTPDFVTYGIVADLKAGESYDFETNCYEDTPHRIKGTVGVGNYTVVASDATHEAKEGYEWRIATFSIGVPWEISQEHGYRFGYNMGDYYNIRLMEDSWTKVDGGGNYIGGNVTFLVSYHGREMECYRTVEMVGGDGNFQIFQISVQVPVGYDGIVFGFRDAAIEWPEKAYIFDLYEPGSYLLFRFA